MARHIRKNIDFLYLTVLVIVSASIVSLLLYFLYCWYTTGKFPIAAGGPASSPVREETVRFFIGSIFVPLLVAFSGIAVAHRLTENASRPIPPKMFEHGTTMQMMLKDKSYTIDPVHSDAVDSRVVEYAPVRRDNIVPAAGENDQPQYCHSPHCDTANAIANDCNTRSNTPLAKPLAKPMATPPATPRANDEATKVIKTAETDFLEQLKDPVNREKLVTLLLSPDL